MEQIKILKKFSEAERRKIVLAGKGTLQNPDGKDALEYIRGRHVSDKVIDKFNVGYCPKSVFHQLRGRIITPIYGTYGDLIAISSRHMEKDHANRFWHESFDKGCYLYGLNMAKDTIFEVNKVIVVEGEFDVLVLHSFGLSMTVGICGSAFSIFQIGLLSRFCSDFYFMFDGDEAGRESIARINELYKKYNLSDYGLRFFPLCLPKDLDPDEYVIKYGKESVINKMKEAKEDNIFD